MKKSRKRLLICLAVPLAVGALSTLFTQNSMEAFKRLRKPPLTPPGWVFPVAWTVLFLLMGAASYLVWRSAAPRREVRGALALYGLQLGFNFLWTILFFRLGMYLFAFFWLLALWFLIWAAAVRFFRISKTAGWLLGPYLAWVAFAGYLNLGVYCLN